MPNENRWIPIAGGISMTAFEVWIPVPDIENGGLVAAAHKSPTSSGIKICGWDENSAPPTHYRSRSKGPKV